MNMLDDHNRLEAGTIHDISCCCPLVTVLSKLVLALVLGVVFMALIYWV